MYVVNNHDSHTDDWLKSLAPASSDIVMSDDLVREYADQPIEKEKARSVVTESLSRALAAVELSSEPSPLLPKPDLDTFDSKTASAVILQAMKGGKGSGDFGHAGRPGYRGGSAAGSGAAAGISGRMVGNHKIYQTFSEAQSDFMATEFSKLTGDDVGWAQRGGAFYVLPDDSGLVYDATHERIINDMEAYKAIRIGAIQGHTSGTNIYLSLDKMDTPTLRRVQKLLDSKIIPYEPYYTYILGKSIGVGWGVHTTLADLLNAKSLSDYRLGTSKEKREKGGPGSGYFGHAGRPGRVGGSSGGGAARAGLSDMFNFKADPEGAKKFREKYDPQIAKIENEKLRTAMQLISKCVNEVALNGSKANSHQVIADLNTVRGMMDDLVSQDLSKNDQDIIDGFSDDRLFSYISPESSFCHSIDATIQSIAGHNIRGKSMIDYAMSNVMQGVDQVDDESILTAVGYQEKKIDTLPDNFGRVVVERDKTVLECNAADSDFHTTISASYILSHKDKFEDYEVENARRVLINNTNEDTGVEDVALEKMQGLKLTRETQHVLEVVPEGSKSPDGSPTDALNRAVKLTQRWLNSGFIPDIFQAFNFAGVFRFTASKLMTVDHFVGEYPDLSIEFKEKAEKGGAGSGDFGHAGRQGKVGGSAPKGGAAAGMSMLTNVTHATGLVPETPAKAFSEELGDHLVCYSYANGKFTQEHPISDKLKLEIQTWVDTIKDRTGLGLDDIDIKQIRMAASDEDFTIQAKKDLSPEYNMSDKSLTNLIDGTGAYTNSENHTIYIRPPDENGNITMGNEDGGHDHLPANLVFEHEFGHIVLDSKYPAGNLRNAWNQLYRRPSFDKKTFYSRTDVAESFAETFALYLGMGGLHRNMRANKSMQPEFDIMDHIVKQFSGASVKEVLKESIMANLRARRQYNSKRGA